VPILDEPSGEYYYWNKDTGVTSWEVPTVLVAGVAADAKAEMAVEVALSSLQLATDLVKTPATPAQTWHHTDRTVASRESSILSETIAIAGIGTEAETESAREVWEQEEQQICREAKEEERARKVAEEERERLDVDARNEAKGMTIAAAAERKVGGAGGRREAIAVKLQSMVRRRQGQERVRIRSQQLQQRAAIEERARSAKERAKALAVHRAKKEQEERARKAAEEQGKKEAEETPKAETERKATPATYMPGDLVGTSALNGPHDEVQLASLADKFGDAKAGASGADLALLFLGMLDAASAAAGAAAAEAVGTAHTEVTRAGEKELTPEKARTLAQIQARSGMLQVLDQFCNEQHQEHNQGGKQQIVAAYVEKSQRQQKSLAAYATHGDVLDPSWRQPHSLAEYATRNSHAARADVGKEDSSAGAEASTASMASAATISTAPVEAAWAANVSLDDAKKQEQEQQQQQPEQDRDEGKFFSSAQPQRPGRAPPVPPVRARSRERAIL
jgi:hypothetical protein